MRCPVCKRNRPLNPDITGVWTDKHGAPVAVAYRCPCGNNRDIPWSESSEPQKATARLAEMATRPDSPEMMWR